MQSRRRHGGNAQRQLTILYHDTLSLSRHVLIAAICHIGLKSVGERLLLPVNRNKALGFAAEGDLMMAIIPPVGDLCAVGLLAKRDHIGNLGPAVFAYPGFPTLGLALLVDGVLWRALVAVGKGVA